jgi:hypothetical protein
VVHRDKAALMSRAMASKIDDLLPHRWIARTAAAA